MMLPTIHLNGSDPKDMLQRLETAATAVQAAIDALQEAAPNGRDYYPQGEHAFMLAQSEYIVRQSTLELVRRDIETLAWHVQDKLDERERQKAGQR